MHFKLARPAVVVTEELQDAKRALEMDFTELNEYIATHHPTRTQTRAYRTEIQNRVIGITGILLAEEVFSCLSNHDRNFHFSAHYTHTVLTEAIDYMESEPNAKIMAKQILCSTKNRLGYKDRKNIYIYEIVSYAKAMLKDILQKAENGPATE